MFRSTNVRLTVAVALVAVGVAGAATITAAEDDPTSNRRTAQAVETRTAPAAVDASAAPAAIDIDLTYDTVLPCRVFDSRAGGGAPYGAGQTRNLFVAGDGSFDEDFPGQGGTNGGCDVPLGTSAVMINLTAVSPGGTGFVRVWPTGGTEPNATVLNFSPALNASNAIAVPIAGFVDGDIAVRVRGASTHIVGDVVGYFAEDIPDPA